MLIEIRKAGFVNKGAELMLHSILQRVRTVIPDAGFAMVPSLGSAPYLKRAELKLLQKAWYRRHNIQWGHSAALLPAAVREMYGIVLDRELDAVLDASGFSYSDQWGARNVIEAAKMSERWHRQGTKVILLPQAFGPFGSKRIVSAMRRLVDHVDLIFARETLSYQHLVDAVGERANIKIAPDFTNLVEGRNPETFNSETCRFAIVPNVRMMDKTSAVESAAYLPFLIAAASHLLERGAKPFLLVHEGEDDYRLAVSVSQSLNQRIPIVRETDPLNIKGIIGSCTGTIGSRFHGLVSALSQGVPSLGTGWSHKYHLLFADYGCPDGIIDVSASAAQIAAHIDALLEPAHNAELRDRINTNARRLKQESEKMWSDVFSVLQHRE